MARLTLSTHWKFQRLSRVIGSKVLARGILETLWEPAWIAGDAYCGTSQDIEALCEWKGEPGALTSALLMSDAKNAGFIEPYQGRLRDAKTPHYQIHDFLQHCPDFVRRRREVVSAGALPKKCEMCGEEFMTDRAASRQFCSHRCRQAAYRVTAREARVTLASRGAVTRDAGVTAGVTARDGSVTARDGSVTPPHILVSRVVSRDDQNLEQNLKCDTSVTPRDGVTPPLGTMGVPCDADVQILSGTTSATSAPAPSAVTTPENTLDTTSLPGPLAGAQTPDDDAPPVDTSPVVLTFPTVGKGGPTWLLREQQIATWQALYPNLDVLTETRKAYGWITADKARRKTAGGMAKCLIAWFNRAVDSPRGRSPGPITGSLKTAGNRAAMESWLRGRNALE